MTSGDRSAGVVLLIIDTARPDHQDGDSMVYDWHGNKIHLSAAGIDIDAPGKRIRLRTKDIELLAERSILTSIGGYAEKLTHVSEGNLVRDVWHVPAVVVDEIHAYPKPVEE
jgi:phage gp45-like